MRATGVWYNENDTHAAAWLRELIKRGIIADGEVDERDVRDIRADDIRGFTQCHFFAGIGVWSWSLRMAGWDDERPVWTGSCPCQPFSAAGKRGGTADERHLWPAWFHLIDQCKPVVVFGEQVASKDGLEWLDLVHLDLEGAGYAVGAVDIPTCGFGAPHKRNRLYFVAVGHSERCDWESICLRRWESPETSIKITQRGSDGDLGNSSGRQQQRLRESREERRSECTDRRPGPTNGFWADAEWLHCTDGKARPTEPGTFPLVDGTPAGVVRGGDCGEEVDANNTAEARVMRLRGYGNTIVAPVAVAFIEAYLELMQ